MAGAMEAQKGNKVDELDEDRRRFYPTWRPYTQMVRIYRKQRVPYEYVKWEMEGKLKKAPEQEEGL